MGISSVKSKYEKQLLQLDHVVGVGIGMHAGKRVIKVYVNSNYCKSLMDELIPETLEGYETQIDSIGDLSAQE